MRPSIWLTGAFLIAVALLGLTAPAVQGHPVVVTGPAPVVTYAYAPPVYVPAPVMVTSYRYGLLGRRRVTVTSYAAPAPVVTYAVPAPVVRYYRPPVVTTYYAPRRVRTYYPAPVYYPW